MSESTVPVTQKTISERTKLPLGLVVTLLTVSIGLGGAAAVNNSRTEDNTRQIAELRANEREHDRRLDKTEATGEQLKELMQEVRQDVKELLKKGK